LAGSDGLPVDMMVFHFSYLKLRDYSSRRQKTSNFPD
jgi:hypothetical protein